MERSEYPSPIWEFFCIYIPDVVAFRLGLFSFFVETRDVRLVPKIGPNLIDLRMSSRFGSDCDRLTFFMGILSSG